MAREREYIRLPGRRWLTIGSRHSMWLGKDHVLHVINRGYTEEYRRFFYGDIQAILLRQTATGKIVSIILGIIAGLSLIVLALAWFLWRWEALALVPTAIAALLWLLIFIVEFTSGPTCICHLRTAVQFEVLPSLVRIRSAYKAIALLRHRVEAVQGPFTSNEVTTDES